MTGRIELDFLGNNPKPDVNPFACVRTRFFCLPCLDYTAQLESVLVMYRLWLARPAAANVIAGRGNAPQTGPLIRLAARQNGPTLQKGGMQ